MTVVMSEPNIDDIFKKMTKTGISEQMLGKIEKLINIKPFDNEEDLLTFLLKINLRLPTQFFEKYLTHEFLMLKLRIQQQSIVHNLEEEWKKTFGSIGINLKSIAVKNGKPSMK